MLSFVILGLVERHYRSLNYFVLTSHTLTEIARSCIFNNITFLHCAF